MSKRTYLVEVPLPGGDQWMTLATCRTADAVAAVLAALLPAVNAPAVRVTIQEELAPVPPF